MRILVRSAALMMLATDTIIGGSVSHAFQHQSATTLRRTGAQLHMAKPKSTAFAKPGTFWQARHDTWRPTVEDVERISWGKPAKQKGTGSRGVPHRLNQDERLLFDQARNTKGYLEIAGSGWRSQRRDAPLVNSYRSLCDARAQASIVLHKSSTGDDDALVIDLSTLRMPETFDVVAARCLELQEGGQVLFEGGVMEDGDEGDESNSSDGDDDAWSTRPIYQLPLYCVVWKMQRGQAKKLGKRMANEFNTVENKKSASKKPVGVKPGKNRRHGGYGIG